MNSPIQWFLLLLCDRRTAPTLFSTLAWYPPVGGTRRIGKDSPVHRPDGLRPSRRRITACDQRFEGYPSMLACYIRRAAGTHEYLYYDSSGQRRAGPQLTGLGTSCALYFSSPPNAIFPGMRRKKERHTAGAPAETMSHGGTAKEVQLSIIHHIPTVLSSTSMCSSISNGNIHLRPGLFAVSPCRFLTYSIAKPPLRNAQNSNRE